MKHLILPLALLSASPAFAAGGPFFSLWNSNFVVLLAFLVFIGILLRAKVPAMLTGMLDARRGACAFGVLRKEAKRSARAV